MCQVNEHFIAKYPAKHFINTNEQLTLLEIIEQSPLATLLYTDNNTELHVSHIPFHFNQSTITNVKNNEHETLIGQVLMGHVSNEHPLAQQLKVIGQDESKSTHKLSITLIFHGEDNYISPNDVSSEYKSHQKVPTWNYAKVHVTGHVSKLTQNDEKYQQILTSSDYFEQLKVKQALKTADKYTPWSLSEAPSKAIKQMLQAITVFTLTISHIEGRFKLSQNKSSNVRAQIAKQVNLRKKTLLAQQMLMD